VVDGCGGAAGKDAGKKSERKFDHVALESMLKVNGCGQRIESHG
jgi:hypothetical protein